LENDRPILNLKQQLIQKLILSFGHIMDFHTMGKISFSHVLVGLFQYLVNSYIVCQYFLFQLITLKNVQITVCLAVLIDSLAKDQPMLSQLLKPMLIQMLILSGGVMDGHITTPTATV
jgi:hypothetical protein